MKLRTFDAEPVRGEMTSDLPVSQDGIPVLLVNDEPFSPEEAEFFIKYATQEDLEMLREGGYDLPALEGETKGMRKAKKTKVLSRRRIESITKSHF